MRKRKLPRQYQDRLATTAARFGFPSGEAFGQHLVDRGLRAYLPDGDPAQADLARVAEDRGYSSEDELIEHLLERGLAAYEAPGDLDKLAARLRGLGYIE